MSEDNLATQAPPATSSAIQDQYTRVIVDQQCHNNDDDDFAKVTNDHASPSEVREPLLEKKNLTMLNAFLLANLLMIIYMLVQAITKIVLTSQDALSGYELAFFRSLMNLFLSSVYLGVTGDSLTKDISADNRWILLMRCLSGSICFLCMVLAIEYIPLSIFFVVLNATPFVICLLAWVWLNDLITGVEIFSMCGAFAGIVLVGVSKRKNEVEAVTEEELLN